MTGYKRVLALITALLIPASLSSCANGPGAVSYTHLMKPVSVNQPKEGLYVSDMGQNFAGWAEIKVTAPRDTKITLKFAEMLYDDGTINQENLRWAENRDIYFCKGDGEETFEPHFTYHGFRYVQLEGCLLYTSF